MDVRRWPATVVPAAAVLVGVPPVSPTPRPVPWWTALRSGLVCTAAFTAMMAALLFSDDAVLRPLDAQADWGSNGMIGGGVSLVAMLLTGRPRRVRYAWAAILAGLLVQSLGYELLHPTTVSNLDLWLQMAEGAGIGVAGVLAAAAVTHLPARRRSGTTNETRSTTAPL